MLYTPSRLKKPGNTVYDGCKAARRRVSVPPRGQPLAALFGLFSGP